MLKPKMEPITYCKDGFKFYIYADKVFVEVNSHKYESHFTEQEIRLFKCMVENKIETNIVENWLDAYYCNNWVEITFKFLQPCEFDLYLQIYMNH